MTGISAGLGPDARALIARAAAAESRTRAALKAAIDDVFVAPEARLDDRTRTALSSLIESLVETIERELRGHVMRLLTGRGEAAMAAALASDAAPVTARLAEAGMLRDADLVGECLARVRCELIAAALPAEASDTADTPSLLARLADSSDRVVALAAVAVMTGESHRRNMAEGGAAAGSGLPGELHQRLLWWVAAALRERGVSRDGGGVPTALDRAIAEAALRNIGALDGGDRLEAAAMRLAAAIDAQPDELPALLNEALRDRRLVLVIALLGQALGVSYEVAREVVLDPAGERLCLALRSLDIPRAVIAQIGYRLGEADARRDVDAFADMLDIAVALDMDAASAAIAPLRLPSDYRAALRALDRRRTVR